MLSNLPNSLLWCILITVTSGIREMRGLHGPLAFPQEIVRVTEKGSSAGSSLPLPVLVFDEAANLDSETNFAVMHSLREWPVWAVFLSTINEITRLAPPHPRIY
ncbi:hypothetical protein EV426DRAFT_163914 [Tirmania nivea]|nr:hypothetical protein EV426DRAFT_163914 [Tirmania nivea]